MAGFHRGSPADRLQQLVDNGFIDEIDAIGLAGSGGLLPAALADRLVENVVSVFGLPLAVAPNFLVNGRDYVVPMVVEEPSVVAGVSAAARLMRGAGGLSATAGEPVLIGQIHLVGVAEPEAAMKALVSAVPELRTRVNTLQPRLVARGGGLRDVELRRLELADGRHCIVVHLLIDTRDAMGANLVNTVCEAVAPDLSDISGGSASLRILSNLADRAIATACVEIPAELLGTDGYAGADVRDGIVLANELAMLDPYRAATHNKGIMNGVDPVAIATGNDWRAIEAAAHAYACRDGAYRALTRWTATGSGALRGELQMPLKVGTVGASLESNPAARIGLKLTGVGSAQELAQLICAVGLAQNFAALKALVTGGIQKGHMALHARSVASRAGAPAEIFDRIVEDLVNSGEIKQWKAQELIAAHRTGIEPDAVPVARGSAAGKVILFGEHAAVYGRDALALPLPDALEASVRAAGEGVTLSIPDWGIEQHYSAGDVPEGAAAFVDLLLRSLALPADRIAVTVRTRLPLGMGLGSSAALAAGLARALSRHAGRDLADDEINALAFECEKIAHGRPSGIDNALAVYSRPLRFNRDVEPPIEFVDVGRVPPVVVAWGGRAASTRQQVAAVRDRYDRNPALYERLFDEMAELSRSGLSALRSGDLEELGRLMNVCHGLLNAIGVSTPVLETMVDIARRSGAIGAKLTGAGGGGAIVALCKNSPADVERSLQAAGYRTLRLDEDA